MTAYHEGSGGMTDATATTVDELIIDPETGEITGQLPPGFTDQMEWLTLQSVEAKLNIDGWEQRRALLKLAMGRLLDREGLRSARTKWGTPNWRARTDRYGKADRIPAVVADRELGHEVKMMFYETAKTLDVGKLTDIKVNHPELAEAVAALIQVEERDPYIQVDPPRKTAPE